MTTSVEVAAALASTILIKGSVIALCILAAARCARSAAGASLVLGLGPGALGLVILLGPLFPQLNSGIATISHSAAQPGLIGTLPLSPVLVLVLVWATGTLVMLARFLSDLRAAHAIVNRADGLSERVTGRRTEVLLRRAARAVGVTRIPELRETTELATVAMIGFRRPVLLIPVQAAGWTDEELFGVLCHELEHVRRGDWLMLMIERIVGAVYWMNPLIILLSRQAAAMRERAADDAALRAGAGASAYASRLIAVARDLKRAPRLAVSVAFANGGRVDQRVRALFEARDRKVVTPFTTLRAALLTIPLLVVLAAVEPWTCLPGETTSTSVCP